MPFVRSEIFTCATIADESLKELTAGADTQAGLSRDEFASCLFKLGEETRQGRGGGGGDDVGECEDGGDGVLCLRVIAKTETRNGAISLP